MRFLRFLSIWTVLAGLLVACAPKLQPQESCNFVQNSQIQRVSWKGRFPISIWVHDSVPSQYHQALLRAMARWEYALGRSAFRIVGIKSGEPATARDGENVIYWMKTWATGRSAEQARTTIFWTEASIEEADMFINASAVGTNQVFDFSYNDPAPSQVDFESLMVHELGHVLGLQHNHADSSVMDEHLASGTKRREIPEADLASLRCEY